jgi:hypothetical protein
LRFYKALKLVPIISDAPNNNRQRRGGLVNNLIYTRREVISNIGYGEVEWVLFIVFLMYIPKSRN